VAAQVRAALAGVEYLHHGWSTLVDGLTAACWDRGAHLAPSGPAAAADGGPLTGPGVDAKGSGPASGRPWPAGAGAEGSGSVDGRAWLAGADVERPGSVDGGGGADEGEEPGAAGGRVRRVVPEGGRVRVDLEDGVVLARRVVVAAGSPGAAARLLPDGAAGWGSLGPAARIAGLDLGVREVPPVQVLFGLDRALYLSCHAPAASGLAPPGAASVQLMWYLRADEDPSPDEARATFTEHARLAGVDAGSAEEARYLHRMVAVSAQPTPATGGLRGRPTVTDSGVDGVLLAGDWIGPTGYLADASLVSGVAAARAAVEGIDREATTHPVSEPAA